MFKWLAQWFGIGGPPSERGLREQARAPDPAQRRRAAEQLGAISCRLEKWGSQGNRVRFQCKIPAPRNPDCLRHFEATSSLPDEAVRRVTQYIERWLQGN